MRLSLGGLRRHPVVLAAPGFPELDDRLARFFEVEPLSRHIDARDLNGKSAILMRSGFTVDRATVERLPMLRAICKIGAACDDIDLDACSRAGVMVTNTPDLGTGVEAEQRMMLIAADNLVAAFGFGRIGGIPANLVNHDVRCLLGCCP